MKSSDRIRRFSNSLKDSNSPNNLEFVLGNKVMVGTVNANREYFEMGVKDLAQAEAE